MIVGHRRLMATRLCCHVPPYIGACASLSCRLASNISTNVAVSGDGRTVLTSDHDQSESAATAFITELDREIVCIADAPER